MRLARFSHNDSVGYAVLDGETLKVLDGHPIGELHYTGVEIKLSDVRLLAPIIPSKIICIGKNYLEHALEMGTPAPEEPLFFFKPTTAIIGPGDSIRIPPQSDDIQHESELAVVISRLCKDVPVERVKDVILGYTCANDVTARDLQHKDGQWARSKGFDTFCPLGPWIDIDFKPGTQRLTAEVAGEIKQDAKLNELVFDIPTIINFITNAMTLLPGDVILTGTPAGVGPMKEGEAVKIAIEGLGELVNRVSKRG